VSDIISVVIPAYNVEKYIDKCLTSLFSQTFRELEVIVVNDGSTDGTADIISKFTADPRLKYIEQKNAGVTAARNNGINAASGDYLGFVDSDDYLELDMYEKLYSALKEAGADAAACDYNLIYDDHTDFKYSNMLDEVIDIAAPNYFFKYCACQKPNNYIWTRLYKTDIVKKSGVRFENFKLGDDTLFSFKLLPHLKRIVNIHGGLYNYLQRSNSNVYTVAKRNNLASVYADTFDSLVNHYISNGVHSFLEAMPVHAYTRLRSIIFYSRLANMDESEIVKNIEDGFRNREIVRYLRDISVVDKYAELNCLPNELAHSIKRIMCAAADNPKELTGVVIP